MAAIKDKSQALKALTATALSLPGMVSQPAYATEGDEVDFQYSHYQEGKRNISAFVLDGSTVSSLKSTNPIEVDSLHGSARVSLTDRVKFAFNYLQDTWGGATPVSTRPYLASGNEGYKFDKNNPKIITGASPRALDGRGDRTMFTDVRSRKLFKTEQINPNTGLPTYQADNRLTHTMSTASPETRKQGDFKLSYNWDEAALSAGGGISIENDYESRFGNIGGRFDFNQKRTTVNVDLSYTNSFTHATLDHDDYTLTELVPLSQVRTVDDAARGNPEIISGTRQDWATHLGLSQVINKDAVLSADFSYTRSTGYLSNPYKGVAFAFVNTNPDPLQNPDLPTGIYPTDFTTFTEQRPEVRNQYAVGGRYVHYINPLDAALHVDYRFSADDWGIQSHTFEADWVQPLGSGWTVTPRIRYYSQEAADFYSPFFTTQQPFALTTTDGQGNSVVIGTDGKEYSQTTNGLFDAQGKPALPSVKFARDKLGIDPAKLPSQYSSDQRLSGFGALSGGLTVNKKLGKALSLEAGFEYYTHQGGLKLGGGGEAAYADYDYWLANAALKLNLDAIGSGGGHDGHGSHHHHGHGSHAPAGVLFDHTLPKAGDWMVGYRYQWSNQSGALRNGTRGVSDKEFIAKGCPDGTCSLAPDSMNMSMHMLDLMYAPTDWLTLMLMPQWADMDMGMRKLDGAPVLTGNIEQHTSHHAQNGHESGGFGDLGMYALFKVYSDDTHNLHLSPGFTAPIADVDLQLRRNHDLDGGFLHYCMMLGSGTWDFAPSLTYTGHEGNWSWGAQANGVLRMGKRNKAGYKLGDIFQATAWGGYNLTPWLTATLRGVYTTQGSIRGQFFGSEGGQFDTGKIDETGQPIPTSIYKFGSMDYPGNYGGRFGDIGFGLSAAIPSGDLAGNRFSVEWLQPVYNNMNGYQQNRDGTLSATWSIMF